MMKKYFYLIITGAFFITTSVSAQIHESGGHSMMRVSTKQSDILKEVKGSPYLYDDFRYGMVTMEGKEPLRVLMRYDINTETFEIKTEQSSEDIFILPLDPDTKYHLGSQTFDYRTINFEGKEITGYFQAHFDGENVSLLEKPSLTFIEPVKARTGYDEDRPGKIKLNNDLYLVFTDGKVENVRLKERDFEKAFSSSKNAEKYFSDNKLKTAEDFIKMLEWYDDQVK